MCNLEDGAGQHHRIDTYVTWKMGLDNITENRHVCNLEDGAGQHQRIDTYVTWKMGLDNIRE